MRLLENDRVETQQVIGLEDAIKYYVSDGENDDYIEDEEIYDELNLQEQEDNFGISNYNDRVSSLGTQSVQEEAPDTTLRSSVIPSARSKAASEPPVAAARRPSTQMRSQTPISKASVPSASHVSGTPLSSQTECLALSSAMPSGSSISQPSERGDTSRPGHWRVSLGKAPALLEVEESSKGLLLSLDSQMMLPRSRKAAPPQSNGTTVPVIEDEDESIYHLPSGLLDLLESFEVTQKCATNVPLRSPQRMLSASLTSCPDTLDSLAPRLYKPKNPWVTPPHYPQELNTVFDDPQPYARIDLDILFYDFYYKQETYQQYLAMKALKVQSWSFTNNTKLSFSITRSQRRLVKSSSRELIVSSTTKAHSGAPILPISRTRNTGQRTHFRALRIRKKKRDNRS